MSSKKRSKFLNTLFDLVEFMGENLRQVPKKFKKMNNGLLILSIITFIVSAFLDYYSGWDIEYFIHETAPFGYFYFVLRSIAIFSFVMLKFNVIYIITSKNFKSEIDILDKKYNILILFLAQAIFSMILYPFGIYSVIFESVLAIFVFLALNYEHLDFNKIYYVIIKFISAYIIFRFIRVFCYNIVSVVINNLI